MRLGPLAGCEDAPWFAVPLAGGELDWQCVAPPTAAAQGALVFFVLSGCWMQNAPVMPVACGFRGPLIKTPTTCVLAAASPHLPPASARSAIDTH
jgi:hypothetical protein